SQLYCFIIDYRLKILIFAKLKLFKRCAILADFFKHMNLFKIIKKNDNVYIILILSALTGILVGLFSIFFHYGLNFLDTNIFSFFIKNELKWFLPVLIGAGGLMAGLLVTLAPDTKGAGTDKAIHAYHHQKGIIKSSIPFIKTVASVITLGFGGSGGVQGPMVQTGAGVGSLIARNFKLSVRNRRILLVAGMAAGLGSFFKAPIAGAIFCNEILYRDSHFEDDGLVPATIAAVIGYLTYSIVYGFEPLFYTEIASANLSVYYLIPLTILAFICTAAGNFFVYIFYFFSSFFKKLKLPFFLKPGLGGFLTGIIAIFVPMAAGRGSGYLQSIFFNEISLGLLILLFFGKILTTSFTVGSGGSAGVFGPSIVIGGALGGIVGIGYNLVVTESLFVDPGTMGILGMAGFFTAVANTPLSTLILVAEITGNFNLLVPGLWVIGLSYSASRHYGIFREQIADSITSPAFRDNIVNRLLSRYKCGEVLNNKIFIKESSLEEDIIYWSNISEYKLIPLVNDNFKYKGLIDLEKISTVTPQIKESDFIEVPLLKSSDTLNGAKLIFEDKNVKIVCIINEDNEFKGIITPEIIENFVLKKILAK
ncbi:MAG: chloride channel protein, partial [Candidatus Muiribacteriota bacterium]